MSAFVNLLYSLGFPDTINVNHHSVTSNRGLGKNKEFIQLCGSPDVMAVQQWSFMRGWVPDERVGF